MVGRDDERVVLTRNCIATAVPAGDQVVLREGMEVTITQALGGSFTVYMGGNLYRVDGDQADALGKEPLPKPTLPDDAGEADVERLVWDQLRTCYDPEIPINIVELGLVYRCEVRRHEDGTREVDVDMTLTAPGCGMGGVLVEDVRTKLRMIPTVTVANVDLVFDPPWHQDMMSDAAKLESGLYY